MKILLKIILVLAFALQVKANINLESLKNHIIFLANDSLKGRLAGDTLNFLAANYIKNKFENIGLKSFKNGYLQEFRFGRYLCRNVIGYIESKNPNFKDEYIIIGAHYDHIGYTYINDTLRIYNGADDNASGVAAMLEIAKEINEYSELLKRSVIFIAFDAEESGLIGSKHFIKDSPIDINKIKAMISIDMIGNLKTNNNLQIIGFGSFKNSNEIKEKIKILDNNKTKLINTLTLWKDYTDTKPFYNANISSLFATTGITKTYHKHIDLPETIDYEGLKYSAEQLFEIGLTLSNLNQIEFSKTYELIRDIKNEFKIGLKFDYTNNNHIYSKGPFNSKSLSGFNTGILLNMPLNNNFSFLAGGEYSLFRTKSYEGDIFLNTIEFTLSLKLTSNNDFVRAYAYSGIYTNYILNGWIYLTPINFSQENINQIDYGIKFGAGIEILNVFWGVNIKRGFAPFYKSQKEIYGLMYNYSYSLSFGYYLF